MTPEAQRIAIAEACGWKFYCINSLNEMVWHKSVNEKWTDTLVAIFDQLPDYLSDLNAMHEAEKSMLLQQQDRYVQVLRCVVGANVEGTVHSAVDNDWKMLNATAAQRAEAFLKTLNLWKLDLSPDAQNTNAHDEKKKSNCDFQKHQG